MRSHPGTRTGYRFLMRQSRTDPNRWQALGSAREVAAGRHVVRLAPQVIARAAVPATTEDVAIWRWTAGPS